MSQWNGPIPSIDARNNPMPTRGECPVVGPKLDPLSFDLVDSDRIMARLLSTNVLFLL